MPRPLFAALPDLARSGNQIVCATHSPILTALPGAQILELSDEGIVSRDWEELELTASWRHFLETPDMNLRYLFERRPREALAADRQAEELPASTQVMLGTEFAHRHFSWANARTGGPDIQ